MFDLVHVFFHDTLAEARASPLRVLRQLGLRKVLAKTQHLLAGQLRQRLGGRGQPVELSAFKYTRLHHLPCTTIRDANQPQVIDQISRLELDVLLVAVCKNILRGELLGLPRTFFVNIHPSLLPAYRGPAPTFWALYHGESQTGVTIHQMTESIDRGAILAQRAVPLDRHRSELEIESELFRLAAEDLKGALQRLLAG